MLNVKDAPTAAYKIAKKPLWLRRTLSDISRKEQAGDPAATNARRQLATKFKEDYRRAMALTGETEAKALAFEAAASLLEHPAAVKPTCRLTRLAKCAALLGSNAAKLTPSLRHAATRAQGAADKASGRLEANHYQLEATRLHAELLEALPGAGFDIKHKSIAATRLAYQNAIECAKKGAQ